MFTSERQDRTRTDTADTVGQKCLPQSVNPTRCQPLEPRIFLSGDLSVPVVDSKAGAPANIYLDFDGEPAATWFITNVPISAAFTQDADASAFNTTELQAIQDIWARVAEKFSPFNINVSTAIPTSLVPGRDLKVIIGGNGAWAGAGETGEAWIGSFAAAFLPRTVYVFSTRLSGLPRKIAEIAAHESGHAFGLSHQSVYSGTTLVSAYNPGDSLRAPAMGDSRSSARGNWWYGTSTSSTTYQDDMAMLAGSTNGFGYSADDHGNTLSTATALTGGNPFATGVIGQTTDQDWFRFSTGGGNVSLAADVAPYGPTLDLKLELRSTSGTLIASADTGNLGEAISVNLDPGTYYLTVGSHGTYGDVGQYTLHGVVPADTTGPSIPVASFHYLDGPPQSPMTLRFAFAEDISGPMGVELINESTSTSVTAQGQYDPASKVLTYAFPAFAHGMLPKGNYHAVIHASQVADSSGNPMVGDAVFQFGFLPGDATGDRRVDVQDLYIMASNWLSAGMTCAQGDFNFDGIIDQLDLGILAINWQGTLEPPLPPSAPMPAQPTSPRSLWRVARQPMRVILQI